MTTPFQYPPGLQFAKKDPRKSTVLDSKLMAISASQIERFSGCETQWWLEKGGGVKTPESANQALGVDIHKQMEDYFLTGKEPTHPSALRVLSRTNVPRYGADVIVEGPEDMDLHINLAGVPVRGKLDLVVKTPPNFPTMEVLDWKTKSSFRYLKTREELNDDIQMVVYLRYLAQTFPEKQFYRGSHINILVKDGSDVCSTSTDLMGPEEIESKFRALEPMVERMKVAAAFDHPAKTKPNLSACTKYGGCPFASFCPHVPGAKPRVALSPVSSTPKSQPKHPTPHQEKPMTLLEQIKAKKAAAAAAAGGAAPGALSAPDAPGPKVAPTVKTATPPKPVVKAPPPPVEEETEEVEEEPVEAPIEEAPKPAKRGRPPKAKVEAPVEEVAPEADDAQLVLCINCRPVGVPSVDLSRIIVDVAPEVLAALKKSNPKEAGAASTLDECAYGSGRKALVHRLTQAPPTGYVVTSGRGVEAEVVSAIRSLPGVFVIEGLS